jgi:rare lipoprotein A
MFFIDSTNDPRGGGEARLGLRTSLGWRVKPQPLLRLMTVAAAAATLSACVQTPLATKRYASRAEPAAYEARIEPNSRIRTRVATRRLVAKRRIAATPARSAGSTGDASTGVASFYWHGTKTASGEKFNPGELTAAHRTLPFGTRLRVTDVTTGRSVTVRVNDRGPFIPGRIVDVSHSAAEALGMHRAGLAKVKLDVVK